MANRRCVRLLVLSDSHGRRDRVLQAVSIHKGVDAILFLGDGLRDLSVLSDDLAAKCSSVRGNCDWGNGFWENEPPQELFLRFGEYAVLMMHGHHFHVKGGTERAISYAAAKGADLLLFGHTHMPIEQYLPADTLLPDGGCLTKPLYLMNPGSLGDNGSYGLADLAACGILLSHGNV